MKYAKKSLGQNFLIDLNVIKKIVDLSSIRNKNILEIGPGRGALTSEILKRKPRSLTLIEKDKFIYEELKIKYGNNKILKIHNEDFLKFDLEKKLKKDTVIFGNLPYNISSQILVKLIKLKIWPPKFSHLILMFQKEMADRIIGNYNTSKYGRLSILANFRLEVLNKFNVSSNCFFPKPKINSTVILFRPKKNIFFNIKNINNLEKVTNIFFSNRRKMINKSMKKIFKNNNFKSIKNINLKSRPSEIKPDKYYEITELFEKS